jgi:hypothetical protein
MKRSNGYGRYDDIGLAHEQDKQQSIKRSKDGSTSRMGLTIKLGGSWVLTW